MTTAERDTLKAERDRIDAKIARFAKLETVIGNLTAEIIKLETNPKRFFGFFSDMPFFPVPPGCLWLDDAECLHAAKNAVLVVLRARLAAYQRQLETL
jgi:hypothetical protein